MPSYGMTIDGVGGIYQVDSTDSETEFMGVKSDGNFGNGQGPGSNFALGDLLMVGYRSTTANDSKVVEVVFNSSGLSPTLTYGGDHLIAKASSIHTASGSQTETYGLQVLNQSNVVCFDSRNLLTGLEIMKVWGRFQRQGGYPGQGGVSPLWINNTANEVYNGPDLKNIYVSCFGSQHVANGAHFMSFKYIYDANGTSGKIKLINAFTFYLGGWLGVVNLQQIVVGRHIT